MTKIFFFRLEKSNQKVALKKGDVKSSTSSRAASAKHDELFLDNLTEIIDLANKTCKEDYVDLDAIKGTCFALFTNSCTLM